FLLRYIETGEKRFNRAQWIVFLLGFGALELNVVYPALAAAYTLLCARPYFRRTLLLFIPSAVFTAIHRTVAPTVEAPAYAMRFDFTMLNTFWKYLAWARGRSEEHTSELQSRGHLVCRLLLEKKKTTCTSFYICGAL